MRKIIIAIDGLSSSGKSTMAKDLAKKIGYLYVDSGAMYRAVTLYSLQNNIFDSNGNIREEKLMEEINKIHIEFRMNPETLRPVTYLNGINVENEIRNMEVSSKVSPVSALPFVRKAMVLQQQEMGKSKGIVMDGRDIGTVVFPEAELKIFVIASPEIRAKRRYDELKEKGQQVNYEEILDNIRQRDYMDQNRTVAPLRQAEDAILFDNGSLNIQQQEEWLLKQFNKVINS